MNESQLMSMRVTALQECEVPTRYLNQSGKAWKLAWSELEDQAYQGNSPRKNKRKAFREMKGKVFKSMGLGGVWWILQPLLWAVLNRVISFVFNQWLETEAVD